MTFTFATEAAYLAAKASGGAVYNAVYGSTDYNAAAVSYITATGRTVVDAKNVIVDRSKGQVGDALLYKGGTYFWCKSLAEWSDSSLGQTMGRVDQLNSAGFYVIGWCAAKRGRECLIVSYGGDTTGAWSSNTESAIANVFTQTSILRGDGVATGIASANAYLPERQYGSSYYVNTWPIPRAWWEAACVYERTGTAPSGQPSEISFSISAGKVTISSTGTSGAFSVRPCDWGYDFDRWYDHYVRVRRPAATGVLSANHGRANTRALVVAASSAAANHCNTYKPTGAPTEFAAGRWWLSSTDEMCDVADAVKILNERGAGIRADSAYWTSDQCNASTAWHVNMYRGNVSNNPKTNGFRVRPLSAFTI